MRAVTVLAVSAAAHAGLLLAMPARPHRLVPPRPATVEIEVDATPTPTPQIDAVAVDYITIPPSILPPASAPAPAPAPGPSNPRSPSPAHITATATATATGGNLPTTSPTEIAPETSTGALSMRSAARDHAPEIALAIPDSPVIDEILSRPPSEEEVPSTGKLTPERDGTFTGKDLTFTAHFNADGTVASIDDKPNFNYKFHIPHPKKIARAIKHHVAAWAEDPYGTAVGTSHHTPPPDGKDDDTADTVTILSGGFDATDALMRMNGEDPYAARKRAFLEKTFDERVQIGTAYRAEQLDKSDKTMVSHLKKLWARTDLDAAAKRRLIFQLWDECAETGGEQLVAGADKARAALLRWVNVHLPADSADAFTDDELSRLNGRRTSSATFAPY